MTVPFDHCWWAHLRMSLPRFLRCQLVPSVYRITSILSATIKSKFATLWKMRLSLKDCGIPQRWPY